MEPGKKKKISLTNINLLFDIVIFTAFLLALDPRATGLTIHEWLGIALVAAIITHLLLHWKWIAQIVARFFRKLGGPTRLNAIINLLFFVDFTIVIFSGLTISRTALPSLGIHFGRDLYLRRLHTISTNLAVFLLGLHAAVHWKWVLNAIKRYVVKPVAGLFQRGPSDLPALPEVK
jgi:hypothetical protein